MTVADTVVDSGVSGILVTAMSIFAGLLLNLLLLVHGFSGRFIRSFREQPKLNAVRFTREVFANISYGILVSVGLIVLVLVIVVIPDAVDADKDVRSTVHDVLSVIIWAGTAQFVFAILMVLKRVYTLIRNTGGPD